MDVVLVNVPWGEYTRPSMQLGLIQALLRRNDIECSTDHSVLRYAQLVGQDDYKRAEDLHRPYAEWVFSDLAFETEPNQQDRFFEHLDANNVSRSDQSLLRRLRQAATSFVADTVHHVLAARPKVVGFTTAMLQTTASAAVARAIKAKAPEVSIVFGGAHCEGATGDALMRALPAIDVAVTEQCDAWVEVLFRRLIEGAPLDGLRGVAWRSGGKILRTGHGEVFKDLETNPIPDFKDYFEQLDQSPLKDAFLRSVPFEGSRGCWWGQRKHCRFCGLNGTTMTFRHRSASHVVDELVQQRRRYGVDTFIAVDEIIPKQFFRELPPALNAKLPGAAIFYEMSPSVPRHHLEPLAGACHLFSQPGIEHLSDPVLDHIGKGISAAHNVALLRRAEELDVGLLWNLICGIPGEREADYIEMLEQATSLHHLQAPNLIPLTLARYSPYHTTPEAFGLRAIGPQNGLSFAYPVDAETLEELALNFEYETTDGQQDRSKEYLSAAISVWDTDRARGARLDAYLKGDHVEITDTRCQPRSHSLCTTASLIYRSLEAPTPIQSIPDMVRSSRPDLYLSSGGRTNVELIINQLRESRLIWISRGLAVALAVPQTSDFWLGLKGLPEPSEDADLCLNNS